MTLPGRTVSITLAVAFAANNHQPFSKSNIVAFHKPDPAAGFSVAYLRLTTVQMIRTSSAAVGEGSSCCWHLNNCITLHFSWIKDCSNAIQPT